MAENNFPGSNCPNVLPDAECVDPDCAYCKIARAEEPRPAPPKES